MSNAEECIDFLENYFEIELFPYQKQMMKQLFTVENAVEFLEEKLLMYNARQVYSSELLFCLLKVFLYANNKST